ncbi:DDE superfamily endonuclease [Acinetobacter calcoaceticus]|uniref:DDE superfamily endonuclease n=1 Tax=Acinetobacter calcoaceticus TaxID=471 RepID=A0A4R1Y581_ACICA|nr:DDE superfamily endonuclease [Acinetobacter calcoaceticus]
MKYENLICFTEEEFERLTGVSKSIFAQMVEVLGQFERQKKKSGRPHSLSVENQLLLTLKYLLHNRTQLQLSADYQLAESNVNRTITKVENALSKATHVQLPQRQTLNSIAED